MARKKRPAIERFNAKVQPRATGCIEWTGGKTTTGYGVFYTEEGRLTMAHRWAYAHSVGPVPDGMSIDHLCRNRACVNPGHLEPVTQRTNLLRGRTVPAANAAKTHCPKSHPLSGPNLYVDPQGGRRCRICRRENNRNAKKAA